MAATETGTFNNFIDGESVERPRAGPTTVINPADGRGVRRRRRTRPPRTSTAPSRPPRAPSRAGRTRRPRERSLRCSRSPTRSRSTATRSPSSSHERGQAAAGGQGRRDPARWSTTCASSRAPRATSRARPRASTSRATRRWIRREPVGVIGQIAPWNYPLMMAIWKIGPALATGNTIVLKPAETTPLTTLRLGELAAEFLPKGVLNVVAGGGETGAALVTHAEVDMVSLTGSVETGKWIAARRRGLAQARPPRARRQGAGRGLRRRRHGDRAETIAGTGYYNAGQDCTAATRVLAGSKVYDDVLQGLADQAKDYKLGDTLDAGDHPRAAQLGAPARARRGLPRARARPRRGRHRRRRARPARASSSSRPSSATSPGRRDGPARDLRPGHHRPAVHRRGRGDRVGQRHAVRPRVLGLDARHRPRAARVEGAALRLRVDQRPHPARDARCRTAASSSPATARTSRCTPLEDYTVVKHVMACLS